MLKLRWLRLDIPPASLTIRSFSLLVCQGPFGLGGAFTLRPKGFDVRPGVFDVLLTQHPIEPWHVAVETHAHLRKCLCAA